MRTHVLTLGAIAALVLPGPAAAQGESVTYNDVVVARTVDVGGTQLQLNGYALRKKVIFKVYVAALYVATPSNEPSAILSADTPRRMVMSFLRGVGSNQICDAWKEGLENNTPDASAELKAQFETLCGYMEDIKKPEVMSFTYVPGQGTTVEVKGAAKGTIPGKEFADAILRTWIGPKPGPGDGFKRDLLGGRR